MKRLQEFITERGPAPQREVVPTEGPAGAIQLIKQMIAVLTKAVNNNDKETFTATEAFLNDWLKGYSEDEINQICKVFKLEETGRPATIADYICKEIFKE